MFWICMYVLFFDVGRRACTHFLLNPTGFGVDSQSTTLLLCGESLPVPHPPPPLLFCVLALPQYLVCLPPRQHQYFVRFMVSCLAVPESLLSLLHKS